MMIVHEGIPQVAGEDQPVPTCCHYWIIETASGPISRGECQICHEVRDFKNSVFDMDRDSQNKGSRKGVEVEQKSREASASPVQQELDQQAAVDELAPRASDEVSGEESGEESAKEDEELRIQRWKNRNSPESWKTNFQ